MQNLIEIAKKVSQEKDFLPFSVYSSSKEQYMVNVPIIKPLLIAVLSGSKTLGKGEVQCSSGSFVFLSNKPNIAMRNIPNDTEYFAVLIEFEYEDFYSLRSQQEAASSGYFSGQITPTLEHTLRQFIEWSDFAPRNIWHLRRQEILHVLLTQGFNGVSSIVEPPTLSHKVHSIVIADITIDMGAEALSSMLAMSESTMRRKLSAEGTSLQIIKDRVKLGHGLHLVQTSFEPIGSIAEKCGYASQSRFTDKFKQLFDITPSELRKTRVSVSGE